MTRNEKTIIICAFRYASTNDLEDVPSVIDFIRGDIENYDVPNMEALLDDVRFSLHFLRNAKRNERSSLVSFGNFLKETIRQRNEEEGYIQNLRLSKCPTYFVEDTEFSRFLIALAFAYAAPRRTYVFGLLRDIATPCLRNFT